MGECPHFEKVFEVALAELGFVGEIFVAVLFVLEVLVVSEDCYSLWKRRLDYLLWSTWGQKKANHRTFV